MRVWDIHPGYLNRQSLLGEHREIHAVFTVLSEGKKGYSRHPETLRWQEHLPALRLRHEQVVAEMLVRGFNHLSPLPLPKGPLRWPRLFIDPPARQFALLAAKYVGREPGRLRLPRSGAELLRQHALSLRAREEAIPLAEQEEEALFFAELAEALVASLRKEPTPAGRRLVLARLGLAGLPGPETLRQLVLQPPADPTGGELAHSTLFSELLLWV